VDIAVCWRCEQPGHIAAECTPPPAKTKKELYQRIDRLVDRWIAGDITPGQKQAWITAEVKAFEPVRKARAK
jgi:hypothetical protein